MTDQIPKIARLAATLDDYSLDDLIAVNAAHRDVAAAHGRHRVASARQGIVVALTAMRAEREAFARELRLTDPGTAAIAAQVVESSWLDTPCDTEE